MQPRWRRMGLSADLRDAYLSDAMEDDGMAGRYVDTVGPSSPGNPAFTSEYGRRKDLDQMMMKVNALHLQMSDLGGSAREILEAMCELGTDYFLGDWRIQAECENGLFDRARCRTELSWFDEFRMTLLAASLLRNCDCITKVAGYVDDDLWFDEGSWDYQKEDILAYMCLARMLTSGTLDQNEDLSLQVAGSRRKRAKLILQGVLAITNDCATEVSRVVEALAKLFSGRIRDLEGLVISSWDASILFNIAVMKDLDVAPPTLPVADYLMTAETVFGLQD